MFDVLACKTTRCKGYILDKGYLGYLGFMGYLVTQVSCEIALTLEKKKRSPPGS